MLAIIAVLAFIVVALVAFVIFSLLDERSSKARLLRERLATVEKSSEKQPSPELALLRDEMLSEIPALDNILKRSRRVSALQTMLEQIPRETLAQYCKDLNSKSFWQNQPADARAFKTLLYTLNFDSEAADDKGKGAVAKLFTANNTNSMYCEFADHFKK